MYQGLSRSLCDVLEEMRKCDETKNYSYLLGLIEEAQTMGNRMESALGDIKELKDNHKTIKDTRKKILELEEELSVLKKKRGVEWKLNSKTA